MSPTTVIANAYDPDGENVAELQRSEPEAIAERLQKVGVLVGDLFGIGDRPIGGMDPRMLVAVVDLDQVVVFEFGQRPLDRVDVLVDGGPKLQNGHPLPRPLDESVQYRHLRLRTVTEFRLGLHTRTHNGDTLTVTARLPVSWRSCDRCPTEEHLFPPELGSQPTMGIRCLLGHDFGETEVEREREENGDEMVATIREVETCRRCGTERVISENKEVTSIRTAEEIGLGSGDRTGDEAAAETSDSATGDAETVDSDARSGTASSSDREPADGESTAASDEVRPADATPDADSKARDGTPAGVGAENAANGADEAVAGEELDDPESDDGVILPEEDHERGHGEWPDAEQAGESATASETSGRTESGAGTDADRDRRSSTDSDARPNTDSDAGESTEETDDGAPTAGEPAVADDEREDVEILGDDETDVRDAAGAAGAAESTAGVTDTESPAGPAADENAANGTTGEEAAREETEQRDADDDDTTAWPDHGGPDEGFDAEVGGTDDVSFSGSELTPDIDAGAPESDAEYVETDTEQTSGSAVEESRSRSDVGTGIAREESASIDLSDVSDDVKFYCPNCGLTRSAGESSMRAGDICPECRKGYIAERAE